MNNGTHIKEVVLIADRVITHDNSNWKTRTLEYTEDDYYAALHNNLGKYFDTIIHYEHPSMLIENANKHRSSVVLSLWSGQKSRNRRTLVPSICEAYDLVYVGADTYTNILCQDKSISHDIAERFGFHTPNHIVIRSTNDIDCINGLHLPVVVKPSFEGGSIGITHDCLTKTCADARNKAFSLLHEYAQPILVEEFIYGNEVSFILYGDNEKIHFCEATQLFFDDCKIDVFGSIYSSEIKKSRNVSEYCEVIDEPVLNSLKRNAEEIFKFFGKVELIRIDGRFDGKRFVFLEFSPDVYLGMDSSVYAAFKHNGYCYADMLRDIIRNAKRG